MWSYNPHQIEGAKLALSILRDYGIVYIAWKERTRKTGTALLLSENSKAKKILVVTKKKAIPGWNTHLKNLPITKSYTIINYESVHKIKDTFDLIILDEAHHAISSIGRTSKTWMNVKKYTLGKPIVYLSATPYSEHLGLIFNQLALSSYSPFKEYINFYKWYNVFGIPKMVRTPYGLVDSRTKYKDKEILDKIQHLFIWKTRQEVGIEHEPTEKLIIIKPNGEYNKLFKGIIEDNIFEDNLVLLDSDSKKRIVHYQLEGGTVKLDNGSSYIMDSLPKIEYIKSNYHGKSIAIMAHFIHERTLLSNLLPEALILSSDGDAEGVDLQHIDKLIIYSMSFKTSKHLQRMARQANHDRRDPIEVDILVMDKPAIGKSIYNTVAIKKKNFDKNSYEEFNKVYR